MNNGEIPLEDGWRDVIRKARRGLALSDGEILGRSGIPPECLRDLFGDGKALPEPQCIRRAAEALGLDPDRLLALTTGKYHPGDLALPEGIAMFTTPWHDFAVHSYLLWDPASPVPAPAVAFDTGSDVSEMLDLIRDKELALTLVLLTHGHGDHVFELDRLAERTRAPVWIGEGESVPGVGFFHAGKEFSAGALRIRTRSTRGHSSGGITYVIHGLSRPIAIVGDALFAGSMGGAMHGIPYADCLRTNREEILSLSPETILCPGHGPLTTVALELAHNPFFPEREPRMPNKGA